VRQPRPEDVDGVVAQYLDPEVQRWTTAPVPYYRSDAQDFIERVADGQPPDVAIFAIVYQGRFAGTVHLRLDVVGEASR
jgi:Acetyltransferase (GNAT) domain